MDCTGRVTARPAGLALQQEETSSESTALFPQLCSSLRLHTMSLKLIRQTIRQTGNLQGEAMSELFSCAEAAVLDSNFGCNGWVTG